MNRIYLVFLISAVAPGLAIAQDSKADKNTHLSTPAGVALVEGFILIDSYIASRVPRPYGVICALLSPLGASSKVSDTTNWVSIGTFASIGLYNAIELARPKYSERQILVTNVLALHGLIGVIYAADKIFPKTPTDKVVVTPIKGGVVISMGASF